MPTIACRIPALGSNVSRGDVTHVLVSAGDTVRGGQPVLVLETDKATIEVPCLVSGIVTAVRIRKGQRVKVGDIALLVTESAEIAEVARPTAPPPAVNQLPVKPPPAKPLPVQPRPVQPRPLKSLTNAEVQRLFLCYRRDDTQGEAGRLYDRLVDAFGSDRVFMDIDSVPLGIDFVEHVGEQVACCCAAIVMIGRNWLDVTDKRGRRRLDNADDVVRAEIAAALKQKVPVIPVLVQNAAMPIAEELPDDIRALTRRNGVELSHTRWKSDVERLLNELEKVLRRPRPDR